MKRLAVLLSVFPFLILSFNCAKDSSEKGKKGFDHEISGMDKVINYTIERLINLDYRAWAKLELTDELSPRARLTFFGTLDPYFTDGSQVTGAGVKVELPERTLLMFDLNFEGTMIPTSGCNDNLNYRLVLLEGETIDMTRGALAVFCGEPVPKNELYIYRVFLKE